MDVEQIREAFCRSFESIKTPQGGELAEHSRCVNRRGLSTREGPHSRRRSFPLRGMLQLVVL